MIEIHSLHCSMCEATECHASIISSHKSIEVGRVDVQHMVMISGLLTFVYERHALVPSGNQHSQRHTVVRSALFLSHIQATAYSPESGCYLTLA